jgi:hypothetical protein
MTPPKDVQPGYSGPPVEAETDAQRFRRTLVKVLGMQVVWLVLLYLLQFFKP